MQRDLVNGRLARIAERRLTAWAEIAQSDNFPERIDISKMWDLRISIVLEYYDNPSE